MLKLRDKMEKYDSVIEEGRVMRFKALERAKYQEKEFRQKEAHVFHLNERLESLTKKQAMLQHAAIFKNCHRNHDIKVTIEENIPVLTYLNSVHQEAPLGRK